MGRDLAFLCHTYNNGWSTLPGDIAIDEQTALLLDSKGNGSVVGNSTVYFLQALGAPQASQPKTPLTYQNISVHPINSTGTFNVVGCTGSGGTSYSAVFANAGVLST
jgi:cyanophycinase-like exopeptidase